MKQRVVPVLLCLTALFGCGTGGDSAQRDTVHFFNWADYIDPAVLLKFEEETGIEVVYDNYDANEVLEAKLLAGSTGYDLVVPSDTFLPAQIGAGVYQPLDKGQLRNYGNLNPEVLAKLQTVDPENTYAVPYAWGTIGLGLNLDAVRRRLPSEPLDSWDLLFDPSNLRHLEDCGVSVLDAPDDLVSIATHYLGLPATLNDVGHLRQAVELLETIRPHIRYFDSFQYVEDLANGETCLAMGWSGNIYQAIKDARDDLNLAYVIPKEGSMIWIDVLAIPSDAPHPEHAHRLLDFMMKPGVAAQITNATFFANGNLFATELVEPGIRGDAGIYPDPEIMTKLFPAVERPESYVRLRTRLWTRLKSGI